MKYARYVVALLVLLVTAGHLSAAENDSDRIAQLEQRIAELEQKLSSLVAPAGVGSAELDEIRRQLGVLAEELEKLRSGEEETEEVTDARRRSLGLGPAAASVYGRKHGVSLAGYGEMLYENFADETESSSASGKTDQLDFLRAVVYFGYRFTDRAVFNSEVEFEHASTGSGGEASVEFAYVDYQLNDWLSLRGGMLLLPMGLVNEYHEPTVYLGARRPLTESLILPSTWRENGFGVVGRAGMFDYRAYVVNGFNAGGFSSSGLRGGRQKGAAAKMRSPSFVGRLDFSPTAGFLVGGSFYAGESGAFSSANPTLDVATRIGELHCVYTMHGIDMRALYARASLSDVATLNAALKLTGNSSVGEKLEGAYIQAGYDVLSRTSHAGRMHLTPYVRYESINTQGEVPAGFETNPAREQTVTTAGVEFRPISPLVVKWDFQSIGNKASSGVNQWNISLGYTF